MDKPAPNPIGLIRLYWRYLAPLWLLPVGMMILQVIEDIGGKPNVTQQVGLFLLAPLVLGSVVGITLLRRRVKIPWLVLQGIWTFPMMAIWCGLVFLRSAIMTILGRPL